MTHLDLTQYRDYWRDRDNFTPSSEMRAEARRAEREARRLSRILADEFGVDRVYLFGSYAWGPGVRPDADLDLAAEGLARGELVRAYARLSRATQRPVHLVSFPRSPYEVCSDHFSGLTAEAVTTNLMKTYGCVY